MALNPLKITAIMEGTSSFISSDYAVIITHALLRASFALMQLPVCKYMLGNSIWGSVDKPGVSIPSESVFSAFNLYFGQRKLTLKSDLEWEGN